MTGSSACGPSSAAVAAAWAIEHAPEVVLPCTTAIALISDAGPPA